MLRRIADLQRFDVPECDVPERSKVSAIEHAAQLDHGLLALASPLVERARDQFTRHRAVCHDDRHAVFREPQWDIACLERPAVDEQRVVFVAKRRRELVHDARPHADVLVLRPVTQQREIDVADRQRERIPQRARNGHFERRGRRKSRRPRYVAPNHEIDARDCVALRHESARDRFDVRRPSAAPPGRAFIVQPRCDLTALAVIERIRAHPRVVSAGPRDEDAAVDRERQDEPVVVVDVLADEVDAPRGLRDPVGMPAEFSCEGIDDSVDTLLVRDC